MPPVEEQGDEGEKTGLFCFLNSDRACGADCMAYAAPPAGEDYKGQQWANCKVITAMHSSSKHLVVLAQVASNTAADKKRNAAPPPPPR